MVKYKTKIKRIMSKLRAHKLMTIVVATLLIIIILVMSGLLLSQQAWTNYETSYSKNINNAKAGINSVIINTLSDKNISSTNKINDLLLLQSKLDRDTATYCKVDVIIGWQSFMKQLSDKMTICQQRKENIAQLLVKIGNIAAYLKAEQSLSSIISKAIDETNQNNQSDKWNKIEAYWRQAMTDTSMLTDAYHFGATKTVAISNFKAIADSWQRLSSANDARDRQKFEAERTNLGQVYAGLSAISVTSKTQVDKLTVEFNNSYKNIGGI